MADVVTVRTELARRTESLEGHVDQLRLGELMGELEFIRRTATMHGLAATVTVVHALTGILSRGERGPRVRTGLSILRDAIDCGRADRPACEAFAATCSMRLGH